MQLKCLLAYYSIKLDSPAGLTEEYLGDDLVPETEIPILQAEWESGVAAWVRESRQITMEQQPVAKFQIGMLVKFSKETGCNLLGDYAKVTNSRYVSSDDWSGWVYQLTNEHLSEPIEIGEYWLEAQSISKSSRSVRCFPNPKGQVQAKPV